jgi:two-component system repressor protein LuxO
MTQHTEAIGRILFFVEDEADIVELYKVAFEAEGFIVEAIQNGKEAIAKLEQYSEPVDGKPEVMILDILLPDISGMDIMHEVRKRAIFDKVPIIMFTNYSSDKIREEIAKVPNTRYMLKLETAPAQLVAVVKEMLGIK